MYIIIDEDGNITKSTEVTRDMVEASEAGIMDIISISGPQPTQYVEGGWFGINDYE